MTSIGLLCSQQNASVRCVPPVGRPGVSITVHDVLERTRVDNRRVSVERRDTEREYSHPRLLEYGYEREEPRAIHRGETNAEIGSLRLAAIFG
jgi:hypothetical protein